MIERLDLNVGGGTLTLRRGAATVSQGLGAHRLAIPYEVTSTELPDGALVQLRGDLLLAGPVPGRWLGQLVADHDFGVTSVPQRVQLGCALTDHQWVAIEEHRRGMDVELQLDIHVAVAGSGGYPIAEAQDRVRVTATDWSSLLEQIGRGVGIHVFVPIPLGVPHEGLAVAARHLHDAVRLLNEGRYRDAVVKSRSTHEWLRETGVP